MSLAIEKAKLSRSGFDFIDDEHLHELLQRRADKGAVRDIIAKSLAKQPLSVEETAALLAADEPELLEQIFDAARQLKRDVYGNRIVLFAPVYIGNNCTNDCLYCAFRRSNKAEIRRTLDEDEIRQQVLALENKGHKRLILVFGEHPQYDARFMAECVQHVYATATARGDIRRVNLNAAPLDHDGYRIVKAAGIGTYQIFQETYHHETYRHVHPKNTNKAQLPLAARRRRPGDGGRVRRRRHRRPVWPVRLAIRGARSGQPRPAPAKALRRRPAHDQFSAAAAGVAA